MHWCGAMVWRHGCFVAAHTTCSSRHNTVLQERHALIMAGLLLLLLLLPGVAVAQPMSTSQAQLLLDMKSHFNNSDVLNSWQGDDPCDGWSFVDCDSQGRVVSIYMPALGLRGSIPPSGYQLPPTLQYLDLSVNNLTGPLPADWRFPSLKSLYLEKNQFTGTMPAFLLPEAVREFRIGDNLLTGTLPDFEIPRFIETLTLDSNLLSGTIPTSWELPPSLVWLNLCCQNLSGAIPVSWTESPRNDTISAQIGLFNNSLAGAVPTLNSSAPATLYVRPGNPGLCGELPGNPMYYTYTRQSGRLEGTPLKTLGDCQPAAEPAGSSGDGSSSSSTVGIAVGVAVGAACLGLALAGAWVVRRRRKRRAFMDAGEAAAGAGAAAEAERKGTLGADKAADLGADAMDNNLTASTPASLLGMLAVNPIPSRVVSEKHPEGSLTSHGSAPAEALGEEKASLGSSNQSKLEIDVSLWTISFQELSLQSLVGKGSFGRVYKAEWAHHTTVAVKVLDGHWPELAGVQDAPAVVDSALHGPILTRKLQQEASLLAALRHPNVVAFLGMVNSPPCLVTEFCTRGSLFDMLQQARKSPAVASQLEWLLRINMALDAARGMAYLHSLTPPVLHRDLKSNNLLVHDNWTCKVADFSVSKIWQESATDSSRGEVGNPRWLAPEVLSGKSHTPASDVYSFAVIMWELLTWELPWAGCSAWQVSAAVVQGKRPAMPSPEALPGGAASFEGLAAYMQLIERCWAHNPQDRLSFGEIVNELSVFRRTSLDQAALHNSGWTAGAHKANWPRSSVIAQHGQQVQQGLTQGVLKRVSLLRNRVPSPFAAISEQGKLAAERLPQDDV